MIKIAETQEALQKIFLLRYEVLRKPWNQPPESASDEKDTVALNAYIEQNGICIACGRLEQIDKNTAQIRYMAVHPAFRGKKYGQEILKFLEERAKEKFVKTIILHARENALNFYLKNGYKLIRPSHLLFNSIQHYLMEKEI